jgi:hypothetical protein
MAETAVKPRSPDQGASELADEAREIRQRYVEQEIADADADGSPQAFYERSVAREDVREILKRLATS